MAEQIIFENGVVKYVTTRVEREIPAAQFIAHIESQLSVNTGILPRNCIYMEQRGDNVVYIIEYPAGLIDMPFSDGSERKLFPISIPFTQFYIRATISRVLINTSTFMSVTKVPLRDLEQGVCIAPYLNIFDQGLGNICTGSMQVPDGVSLIQKVNAFCAAFFQADANLDLTPAMPSVFRRGRENYRNFMAEWADFSKEDRFFGVSKVVEYRPHRRSVKEIVNQLFGQG